MLSCRQFEYFPAWDYCGGFFVSCELKRQASLFLEFRFMFPGHAHCVCLIESWVWLLLRALHHPSPHSNALLGRYFVRTLSCRQFGYPLARPDIVLFSLFIWSVKTCVFILWTSFSWFLFRHNAVAWYNHGLWSQFHPSPHANAPSRDVCVHELVILTVRIFSFRG